MSTSAHQVEANRINSQASTGPVTAEGKAVVSQNARRHGLLSSRLFLEDEDPAEYDAFLADLFEALRPVGTLECALVERIAVGFWRQRRLVRAETASIALGRLPRKIAGGVSSALGKSYGNELKPADLAPFDAERETWCRTVLAEVEEVDKLELEALQRDAPLTYQQLQSDAAEDSSTPEAFVAAHKGGLGAYIAELLVWCRQQIKEAEERPQVIALADQVRAQRLALPAKELELLSRYQISLDGQVYKALRALRDAQQWRLSSLEAAASSTVLDGPETDCAV